MKNVLKIVIVVIVLHAMAQAGMVAWTYYRFRDTAQQLITFGPWVPTGELYEQILSTGREFGLPLEVDDVTVERQGSRTTASARYIQQYEFFPNNFYPVELSFQVETFSIAGGF